MIRKSLVLALSMIALVGCVSMEQRKAQLWAPITGPNVEDAKIGVFHAPLKKVFQASLDVLDDKGISIGSQGPDYIKSGHYGAAGGIVTEMETANFVEDTAAGTVTVKWRTYVVTAQGGFGAKTENQESQVGDSPEDKMNMAQQWYAAIYKKLNP